VTWLPDDRQIRALHERFAPGPLELDLVHTHCRIVWRIAEQILAARPGACDIALVRAGCLLHDIGVYRLADGDSYLRHGLLGHDLLRELGFPETLGRFCSHHTGVGITRDDVRRQSLPLPPGDYLAETPEEHLVMYADKFHSKTSPPVFVSAAAYETTVRRFGDGKVAVFREMVRQYGEPDLTPLSAEFGHPIT
jgi:uncharacterized protein